ncbi:MAG: hypothetical protein AB1656_04660 [Candidatus Omnitrophota bacterium]
MIEAVAEIWERAAKRALGAAMNRPAISTISYKFNDMLKTWESLQLDQRRIRGEPAKNA